jgi:hypothetical protein
LVVLLRIVRGEVFEAATFWWSSQQEEEQEQEQGQDEQQQQQQVVIAVNESGENKARNFITPIASPSCLHASSSRLAAAAAPCCAPSSPSLSVCRRCNTSDKQIRIFFRRDRA